MLKGFDTFLMGCIVFLTTITLFACQPKAHGIEDVIADEVASNLAVPRVNESFYLVIAGNSNFFQFSSKKACNDEADRLNKMLRGWNFKAVCVEIK